MRKNIERMANSDRLFLKHLAEDFMEPQQLHGHEGEVVTVAFEDGCRESGQLMSADEKEFTLNDGRTAAPFYLDTIKYFYIGTDEAYKEQHGYEVPTDKAVDFIRKEAEGVTVPKQLLYRLLYFETFQPIAIDGVLFDKTLLKNLYNIGYAHYMKFVRDKMDGYKDKDIDSDIKDIAATKVYLEGGNEAAAVKCIDEAVKFMNYGKR